MARSKNARRSGRSSDMSMNHISRRKPPPESRPHSITIDPSLGGNSRSIGDDQAVENFLQYGPHPLCPPSFNWWPLRKFMKKVIYFYPTEPLCLLHVIYPRPNYAQQSSSPRSRRNSSAASSASDHIVEADFMSVRLLREKLGDLRSTVGSQRLIIFITNMTPLYARTVAIQEDVIYRHSLRRFLLCHIAGEIEFQALQTSHADGANISWPRHANAQCAFDFEFHLSYVAIRNTGRGSDIRGLREDIYMIEPYGAAVSDPLQDVVCYDAQISFMIIGTANHNWKAYCLVDTWFDSEQSVEEYHRKGQDAPSGGVREADQPCLNPMEYFLLVLSHRLRQTGMEWGNVLTILMERLDTYESRYQQTIEKRDKLLREDQTMSRIRSYCKAASMLRQYHDTLSTTLDRLDIFLKQNDTRFNDRRDFQDKCGCYRKFIDIEMTHLNRWRRRLHERMQRFDTMRDGLQSRRQTRQADQIGVLTYVTVLYLPFGLIAAILGVSTKALARRTAWLVFGLVGAALTVATVSAIFKSRIWRCIRSRPRSLL